MMSSGKYPPEEEREAAIENAYTIAELDGSATDASTTSSFKGKM